MATGAATDSRPPAAVRLAVAALVVLTAVCALWAVLNLYTFAVGDPLESGTAHCYADHPIFAVSQLVVAAAAVMLTARAVKTSHAELASARSVSVSVVAAFCGLFAWLIFVYAFLPEPMPIPGRCNPLLL